MVADGGALVKADSSGGQVDPMHTMRRFLALPPTCVLPAGYRTAAGAVALPRTVRSSWPDFAPSSTTSCLCGTLFHVHDSWYPKRCHRYRPLPMGELSLCRGRSSTGPCTSAHSSPCSVDALNTSATDAATPLAGIQRRRSLWISRGIQAILRISLRRSARRRMDIGVSGSTVENDHAVAEAGARAVS
jgi:hypothetical protein